MTLSNILELKKLQALIKTVNNAFENTNSEIEDDFDIDNNDPSQNDPSPEVNFETDILSRQEQVRKQNEC